jgi:hypothetical protein
VSTSDDELYRVLLQLWLLLIKAELVLCWVPDVK